ncbi:MAG: Toxin YhaV [Chlamydiae bacterium]|nr:Toxin YhaV [Chlamydiota bacterium]
MSYWKESMFQMKSKYLLKCHKLYAIRAENLKAEVQKLKSSLPQEKFVQHPKVKFAALLREATLNTIPEDPDIKKYKLHGDLKKYRRYKQGLKRYRLFFAFSSKPPIILYLYVNDAMSLREDGDKNDPYHIFSKLIRQKKVSHDPCDPRIKQWIQEL